MSEYSYGSCDEDLPPMRCECCDFPFNAFGAKCEYRCNDCKNWVCQFCFCKKIKLCFVCDHYRRLMYYVKHLPIQQDKIEYLIKLIDNVYKPTKFEWDRRTLDLYKWNVEKY